MRERVAAQGDELQLLWRPKSGMELTAWMPRGVAAGEFRMIASGNNHSTIRQKLGVTTDIELLDVALECGAVAFFALNGNLAPEWRLLVITGFCGGLTTFSSFSAEVVMLLRQERVLWACSTAALHLVGSLLMTFAGIATVAGWKAGTS